MEEVVIREFWARINLMDSFPSIHRSSERVFYRYFMNERVERPEGKDSFL